MKPYFAKYIPVPGEIRRIKGGMRAFDSNGVLQYIAEDVQLKLLPNLYKKYKCAALFLCSRDIKVGDKIRSPQSGNGRTGFVYSSNDISKEFTVVGNDTDRAWITEEKKYLDKHASFKVIGLISPEATWVKEGDEFDEDEIQIIFMKNYKCLCEKPNIYRSPEQFSCKYMVDDHRGSDFCVRKEDVISYIKVKGCCNHFH